MCALPGRAPYLEVLVLMLGAHSKEFFREPPRPAVARGNRYGSSALSGLDDDGEVCAPRPTVGQARDCFTSAFGAADGALVPGDLA